MSAETWSGLSGVGAGLGAVVGVIGSLLMAHTYHPFSFVGFLGYAFKAPLFAIFRKGELVRIIGQAAELNQPNRGYLFAGLCMLFWAFFLQLASLACSWMAGPACG